MEEVEFDAYLQDGETLRLQRKEDQTHKIIHWEYQCESYFGMCPEMSGHWWLSLGLLIIYGA